MRLRAKRNDLVAFYLPNLLIFEPNNFVVRSNTTNYIHHKKRTTQSGSFFVVDVGGLVSFTLDLTTLIGISRPPYFRLAFACSRTASRRFFVTPNHKIKNRAFAHFLFCGGCGRTRTADPYDVNVVL